MPINLETHTVVELKQLAKIKGLKGYSKLTKSNLIALIRKGEGGGGKATDKCKNKKCTSDSICNPSSGRCVKKSGEIGKKLLTVSIRSPPVSITIQPVSIKTPPEPEWIIYTIKDCDLCKQAKNFLDYYNIKYYTREIVNIDNFQAAMGHIIGDYKLFPVILKNKKFIGGYQELKFILPTVFNKPPIYKPIVNIPQTPPGYIKSVLETPPGYKKPDYKNSDNIPSTPPGYKNSDNILSTPPGYKKPDNIPSTPPGYKNSDNIPSTPPGYKKPDNILSTPPGYKKPDNIPSTPPGYKKSVLGTPPSVPPSAPPPKLFTPKKWNIYTIKGCDLCKKAKDLLKSRNIEYYTQEITDIKKFQHDMKYIIGDYKYFPVILEDLKFIGGYEDLVKFFSKPLKSPIHMMIPPVVDKTEFIGLPWQEIASLTYLLHKYPKECVAIPFGGKLLSPSGGRLTDFAKKEDYEWSHTSLQWSEIKEDFIIPSGLWISIRNCLKKGSDFILIPMGFLCKNFTAHSNFLIYDTKTKELERFEPNGDFYGLACVNPPKLEERLRDLLNSNVDPDMVKKVYAPTDFCPRTSFQALQSMEGQKKPGDPSGFCAAWAVWYADTRLANPNKSRKEVVDMALSKFKSNPGKMTEFIRSYSAFLNKTRELWKHSNDPFSDIFASLIKEYS